MDEKREQAIIEDEGSEQTNIIIKINGWGERIRYHNRWGERASYYNGWGERGSYYM